MTRGGAGKGFSGDTSNPRSDVQACRVLPSESQEL